MKKRKTFLIVSALLIALSFPCESVGRAQPATTAEWWAHMFHGLKPTYNITVVIAAYQQIYELKNVTAVEAQGRFLILRQKGKDKRDYRVIINEKNIVMIREGEAFEENG